LYDGSIIIIVDKKWVLKMGIANYIFNVLRMMIMIAMILMVVRVAIILVD
jgi:hypothetical protein